MNILAKPDRNGTTLEEHVQHLEEQCDQYFLMRPFVSQKYQARTGEDLGKLVRAGVRWHDEGKKHKKWQEPCRKDYDELRLRGKKGVHLQKAGIRHELASLEYIARGGVTLPETVRAAIAAHHGKLSLRHKKRWGEEHAEFDKFWKEFSELANAFQVSEWEQAILKRYEFAGPRALLQLADHRASAFENDEDLPELKPFNYAFPYRTRQGVQIKIKELWNESFAILRAPTGAGKTDAALLWARHQIAKGRADRLVIAMPTRFTANALAISTAKDLSAIGLYHSSAWYQRRKANDKLSYDEEKFIDKEQEMARLLETPVTVTTIDHLCISLTGTREDHHAIFFNLAHSCVVIDEADFYDEFTQQNIVTLLRAFRLLNVPVLLMSATVPESARELYGRSGFAVPPIFEDKTNEERPRCSLKRHGKAATPNDVAVQLKRGVGDKPVPMIVYANTVKRAQAYYKWFKAQKFQDVVLYHSRFTEPHKAEKEAILYKMLGRRAWKEGKAHGIAILTQIGELSINISADLMISDLCPLDRLTQRAGRLSRFLERGDGRTNVVGELFIVDPCKIGDATLYPAPYGRWKGGSQGWEISEALKKSDVLLKDGLYSAKQFVDLVNDVYPAVPPLPPHVLDNQQKLEDCIVGNWLILPNQTIQRDDDQTKEWKSRDIPYQYTVYADRKISGDTDESNQSFKNWSRFHEFELKHGVQCHAYEHEKAVTNARLEETHFVIESDSRDDAEPVKGWIVKPDFYDFHLGLHFDDEDQF